MRIGQFPYENFKVQHPGQTIKGVFKALYHRRVLSLLTYSVSVRQGADMLYLDHCEPAKVLLPGAEVVDLGAMDRQLFDFHKFIYGRVKEVGSIITGRPRLTFALLDSEVPLVAETAMLRKRGVRDLQNFVYEQDSWKENNWELALQRALALCTQDNMNHLLMLIRREMLIVCAANIFEAMVHFQNIEHSSSIQFASIWNREGLR